MRVFLNEVEKSIEAHDWDSYMKLVDETYKKEQHDDLLQGRTEQFISEMLCGYSNGTEEYLCPVINEIEDFTIDGVPLKEEGYFSVPATVRIKSGGWLSIKLMVVCKKIKDKTDHRLLGALG